MATDLVPEREALETKVPEAAVAITAADESVETDGWRLAWKLETPGTFSALPHLLCKLFVR